jgi:hypothetical protein
MTCSSTSASDFKVNIFVLEANGQFASYSVCLALASPVDCCCFVLFVINTHEGCHPHSCFIVSINFDNLRCSISCAVKCAQAVVSINIHFTTKNKRIHIPETLRSILIYSTVYSYENEGLYILFHIVHCEPNIKQKYVTKFAPRSLQHLR